MGAETKTFMPSLKTMSYVMTRDVLGRNVWGARPLPFPPLPPPLRSRPLKYRQGVRGSAVSSPVWSVVEPQCKSNFVHFIALKSDIWWHQIY